jgi:hypothetical protein
MPRANSKKTKRKGNGAASSKRRSGSAQPALLGLGPVKAYIAAKRIEPRVTLSLLWGIAGAVTDTHWTRLPAEYRASLLLDYDAYLDASRSLAALSNNR